MKRTITILLLTLSACASSDHLEKGVTSPARTPTRNPTFHPEQDAPHTAGQPGHQGGKRLPRSPDRRVLPPEERPGIWASDGDERRAAELKASQPLAADRPKGVPKKARDFCRQEAEKLAQQAGAEGLTPSIRRCLEDRYLRLDCAEGMLKRNEDLERKLTNWNHPFFTSLPGGWDRDDLEEDSEKAAKELEQGPCRDPKDRKAALNLFHGIRSAHGGKIDWAGRLPTGRN